jgi:peptide/nickel transport system permease protein
MRRFIARRLFRAALTLVICVSIVFVGLRLSGDPADMLLPEDTPAAAKAEYRTRWGLDGTIAEQFVRYVDAVAHGDLGISFAHGASAARVVGDAVPNTLSFG